MTVFDPGLQPERTELAWRRTALAVGVGSLVSLRLLPASLGDVGWVFVGLAGLAVTAILWGVSRARSRAVVSALLESGDRAVLPGAVPLVFLAAVAVVSGGAALVIVVVAAASRVAS